MALRMATMMDVSWFQIHRKLHNTRKNILKLTNEDETLNEICEHFGPRSSKNGWRYDQKFEANVVKKIEEFYWKVMSKIKPPNHEFSL
jgi:hypothetical protein